MKTLHLLQKVVLICAILCTIPAIIIATRTQLFINNAVSTVGEIIDVRVSTGENGSTYIPTIAYKYEGESFEFTSRAGSGNPDSYKRWSEIELLVHPSNPEKVEINGRWELWVLTYIVGGFAILLWLTFLALVRDIWKTNKFRKFMREHGIPVQATISEIKTEVIKARNSGVTVKRTIWRAYAKGVVNGEERTFKSTKIPKEPTFYGVKPGAPVTVYVHPKKPKKIFMDFSSFPGSEFIM